VPTQTQNLTQPSPEKLSAVSHLLPSIMQEMAGVLGLDRTLRVASALAGTTRAIPVGSRTNSAKPVQKLVDDLGCEETAKALIKHYGGTVIYLPRCVVAVRALRNMVIHQAAEDGLSAKRSMVSIVTDLAQQFRLSDRRIWEILKEPTIGARQVLTPRQEVTHA